MASTTNSTTPQVHHQSSTHMMKTTRTGRPFVKDIHDLYATLIVSLPMETHRHMFRAYPNTFTTDEAVQNLGSLKFTQSNRTPDPRDSSRIITTTTTTTFSMTRDMAKSVCQTFMDARLFESISDAGGRSFKDKGLYALTPKGLYVLERFITRNGITSAHLARLLASQTSPIRLYYLERSPENDSLLQTWHALEPVFQHIAGRQPNVVGRGTDDSDADSIKSGERGDRSLGIELKDYKGTRCTFTGASMVEWLCDFTTVVSREEAQKIGSAFLQHKLITPAATKGPSGGQQHLTADQQPEPVRMSKSTVYIFTENGHRVARWEHLSDTVSELRPNERVGLREMLSTGSLRPNSNRRASTSSLSRQPSNVSSTTVDESTEASSNGSNNTNATHRSHRESMTTSTADTSVNAPTGKESTARRLQQILDSQQLCSLFMDFVKTNLCSENLLFLLDVRDFKQRYGVNVNEDGEPRDPADQRRLVGDAFRIYNTYLASGAPNELNIDHALQKQTSAHITSIITSNSSTKSGSGQANGDATTSNGDVATAPKLTTVYLFDKIQETIFRLVASDSVPKFVRTEAYLSAAPGRRDDPTEAHRHQKSVSTTSSASMTTAPNTVAAT